jgi:hypothetical protein
MLKRFPARADIPPVFAVITFMLYAWTLVHFFWSLPSQFFYLYIGEIFAVFSYAVIESLFESLALLGFLLAFSFLLPPAALRDVFIVRGTSLALILAGSVMLFWNRFSEVGLPMAKNIYLWTVVTIAVALLAAFISTRIKLLAKVLAGLADRMIIFLYLSMPLSAVALVTVLARNFLGG